MSNLKGFVPYSYSRLLYEYLGGEGCARIKEVFPATWELNELYSCKFGLRVPLADWRKMLDAASDILGDSCLGINLAKTITPAHFGIMGYVFLSCGTVAEVIPKLSRFQRLYYDVNPFRYKITGDSVIMEWADRNRPGSLVDELAVGSLIQLARDISGLDYSPEKVCFVNKQPMNTVPYENFFRCQVVFDAPITSVQFPTSFLALPLRQPDPVLLRVLEEQALALMSELPQEDEFMQKVRMSVVSLARESQIQVTDVASILGVSTRTLQRYLSSHGVSFTAILDDTRQALAEEYLQDPHLQLTEVAQLLGYSEQSSFCRSFRRWKGCSPRALRKLLKLK